MLFQHDSWGTKECFSCGRQRVQRFMECCHGRFSRRSLIRRDGSMLRCKPLVPGAADVPTAINDVVNSAVNGIDLPVAAIPPPVAADRCGERTPATAGSIDVPGSRKPPILATQAVIDDGVRQHLFWRWRMCPWWGRVEDFRVAKLEFGRKRSLPRIGGCKERRLGRFRRQPLLFLDKSGTVPAAYFLLS